MAQSSLFVAAKNTSKLTLVLFTFICYSVYANRRNGEQCSTEEMLTYMYHNEEFSGHIIVRTTTCIQRCCFVQNPSVAQNVANNDALEIKDYMKIKKNNNVRGRVHMWVRRNGALCILGRGVCKHTWVTQTKTILSEKIKTQPFQSVQHKKVEMPLWDRETKHSPFAVSPQINFSTRTNITPRE